MEEIFACLYFFSFFIHIIHFREKCKEEDKYIFFLFYVRYLRYREYREKVRINPQERIEILGSSGILKRTNNLLSPTRFLSFFPFPSLECVSSNGPVPHL